MSCWKKQLIFSCSAVFMLSTVISKKRGSHEISTDGFDVYVPQKKNRYGDELAMRLANLSFNHTPSPSQEQYKL